MKKIGGLEGKILKKYVKEKVVNIKDKPYVERLANVGLMIYRYSVNNSSMIAKTTQLGYDSMK